MDPKIANSTTQRNTPYSGWKVQRMVPVNCQPLLWSEPLHLATPWHSFHLDLANPHTHRRSSLPLTPPLQGMMKLRVVCFSILKLSWIFEHSKLPPSLLHPQNLKAKVASGRLPFLHVGFSQRGPQRSVHLPAVGSAVQICFSRSLVGLYHLPVRRHRSRCRPLSQGSQYSLTVWSFYISKKPSGGSTVSLSQLESQETCMGVQLFFLSVSSEPLGTY